jgi:hypothetical protein
LLFRKRAVPVFLSAVQYFVGERVKRSGIHSPGQWCWHRVP